MVATNLHADILSDLAAALSGSLGIAPTANLNPERRFPSMFEPIHGSAFDITGKGIANPIGTFWTAAMMLEHLGESRGGAADAGDRAGDGRCGAAYAGPRRQGDDAREVTEAVIAAILGNNAWKELICPIISRSRSFPATASARRWCPRGCACCEAAAAASTFDLKFDQFRLRQLRKLREDRRDDPDGLDGQVREA